MGSCMATLMCTLISERKLSVQVFKINLHAHVIIIYGMILDLPVYILKTYYIRAAGNFFS